LAVEIVLACELARVRCWENTCQQRTCQTNESYQVHRKGDPGGADKG
jgi:hypothetical protein